MKLILRHYFDDFFFLFSLGALLTLVPKQSSMYNISTMSDKSDRHLYHKYETLNLAKMGTVGGGISGGGINHSPPLSRATSPLNHDYDNGLKVWHLVSFSFVFLKSFEVLWNPS